MDPSAVPVIDHADLVSDRPEALARAAAAVETGLGTYGLIYVRGHEVQRARVLELYDQFLALLDRPIEEKRAWGGSDIWYQRGWTPPNTEQAVIAGGQPDFKECWFTAPMPLDPLCKRWFPEVYTDNVWPEGAEASARSSWSWVGSCTCWVPACCAPASTPSTFPPAASPRRRRAAPTSAAS